MASLHDYYYPVRGLVSGSAPGVSGVHYSYPIGYSTAGEGLKPVDFRKEFIKRKNKRSRKKK